MDSNYLDFSSDLQKEVPTKDNITVNIFPAKIYTVETQNLKTDSDEIIFRSFFSFLRLTWSTVKSYLWSLFSDQWNVNVVNIILSNIGFQKTLLYNQGQSINCKHAILPEKDTENNLQGLIHSMGWVIAMLTYCNHTSFTWCMLANFFSLWYVMA